MADKGFKLGRINGEILQCSYVSCDHKPPIELKGKFNETAIRPVMLYIVNIERWLPKRTKKKKEKWGVDKTGEVGPWLSGHIVLETDVSERIFQLTLP